MFKCENCPYHYKGKDDDFACCHFEGDYLAPCEEDDCEGEPYEDDPVYENDGWDMDEEEEY